MRDFKDMSMIVDRINKVKMDRIKPKEGLDAEKVIFKEMMASGRDKKTVERLNKMVAEIEKQGKVLAEKRTVDNLYTYKKMIKDFMSEAVEYGLKLEKQGGFRRGGRSRVFNVVKKVDAKLLDLTDEIVGNQKKGLNILSLVGEVSGLLMDIYT